MSERIDHVRIRTIILDAIGPYGCIHEAREHGIFLIPARDRAIELAMPMGPKIAQQYRNRMPDGTRVDINDLEQAGRQGVLEGIDRYQPRKLYRGRPIQVDTYLYLWIRKRVLEEIAESHWLITKPPRDERERYFKDEMTELERIEYANLVLSPKVDLHFKDDTEWVSESEWKANVDREGMQE